MHKYPTPCEAAIQKVSIFIFSIILHKIRKSLLHLKYPLVQAKKTWRAEGGGEYIGIPWYLAFLKGLRLFVFSTRYNNLWPFKSKMYYQSLCSTQRGSLFSITASNLRGQAPTETSYFFLSWNLVIFENLLSFKNVFLRLDIFIVYKR